MDFQKVSYAGIGCIWQSGQYFWHALHNCNHTEPWPGHPDLSDKKMLPGPHEYQLKPSGILISPVLLSK